MAIAVHAYELYNGKIDSIETRQTCITMSKHYKHLLLNAFYLSCSRQLDLKIFETRAFPCNENARLTRVKSI